MILFNKTKIPNELLILVLYRAAKAVGAVRTSKVVIKVTVSKYGSSGMVEKQGYFAYHRWFLEGRHSKEKNEKGDLVWTDGGYMFLRLSSNNWRQDPLIFAERIFSLASHEWHHVKEFQKHKKFGGFNRNWKNRPHERRAVTATNRANRTKDRNELVQEAILNLALYMEEIWKPKKEEYAYRLAKIREK